MTPTFSADLWNEATRENQDATDGSITVETLTSATITGTASIRFDANNAVGGHFEIVVCP